MTIVDSGDDSGFGGDSEPTERLESEVTPADFSVATVAELREGETDIDPASLSFPSLTEIEAMRCRCGLSQSELASRANLSGASYSQWIRGRTSPASDSAARIVRALENEWEDHPE